MGRQDLRPDGGGDAGGAKQLGAHFVPDEVICAARGGVGRIGRGAAGQTEVDVVLGADHAADLCKQLRRGLLEPHQLEQGIAGGGEAVAGLHVPVLFVDVPEKCPDLLARTGVGPDGDGIRQRLQRIVQRDGHAAVAGEREAADLGRVDRDLLQQNTRAFHNAVPPVGGLLLMPARCGVGGGIFDERLGERLHVLVIQRCLDAAGTQIVCDEFHENFTFLCYCSVARHRCREKMNRRSHRPAAFAAGLRSR